MRFMRLFQPSQNEDATPLSPSASSLVLYSSHNGSAVAKGMNFDLMQHLSKIIPWNKLQHPLNVHSASRTSAALSILMPESEPGQHDILSADLSVSKTGIQQHMNVLLYLISNSLTLLDPGDTRWLKSPIKNDEPVLRILQDTGWDDLEHLQILLSTREPTAESITETLFAAAIRRGKFDILQKMLQAGMNPDGLIENFLMLGNKTFFTPLQFVSATDRSGHSINILISHGANVNYSDEFHKRTALYYAIVAENETAIRLLLAHGATVTWECARAATRVSHFFSEHFGENILDIYFDQDVGRQWDDTKTLELALRDANVPIVELFLAKGANLNELLTSYSPFGQTTVLGIAASTGNLTLVRLLLHISLDEYPFLLPPNYISPLALAVERGYVDIVKVLLDSGADSRAADDGEKTLLERAVPQSNLALCQVLISYGAQVDRKMLESPQYPSALMLAVEKKLMSIIDLLISSNARLNDVLDVDPGTILAAAIETGDEVMIEKLINAGARLIGFRIRKIGNLQTALFLQNDGILSRVLDQSGPKLLASAILDHHLDLAWFLLQNNADRISSEADDLLPTLLLKFTGCAPTAVLVAVSKASMSDLRLLREANVELGGTPQMSYHQWKQIKITYCLHNHRLKPESVLEISAWKADDDIFKYLLEWASSAQIDWSPKSVSHALTIAIFKQKQFHIIELMRLESDLNCALTNDSYSPSSFVEEAFRESTTSYTPLQAAVRTQQVSVVRDLIVSKGADVNYFEDGIFGRTPLQHAVQLGNMEIFNLLIEHGADINAPAAEDGGATALQIAAIQGYIGIARKLLDLGSDVNQDPAWKNGRTALMGAAEHGRIDMLQMLLDEGAQVVGEYESYYYESVALAEGRGHYAAARLLKSFKDSVESGT
ncbi:unnamed protein product [Penicillium manginii]